MLKIARRIPCYSLLALWFVSVQFTFNLKQLLRNQSLGIKTFLFQIEEENRNYATLIKQLENVKYKGMTPVLVKTHHIFILSIYNTRLFMAQSCSNYSGESQKAKVILSSTGSIIGRRKCGSQYLQYESLQNLNDHPCICRRKHGEKKHHREC